MSPRRLSYAALMVAAGLTGVYAETIPNFEVLTLVVFGAGTLLGARDGALVGAVTELIYSLLNPYGVAHPLVTASQVCGMAAAGVAGGIAARAGLESAGLADLASFWSSAGRPGWSPDAWLPTFAPWTLAGHVVGSWSVIENGRAPFPLGFPGVHGAPSPLVWYDSVAVSAGG